MQFTLQLPAKLDEAGAIELLARLFENADAKKFVLDFSTLQFALPLGTLLLGSELRRFFSSEFRSFEVNGIDTVGRPAHSYLAHIGFFKGVGLPIGKQPGQATGSTTYMPIRVLSKRELESSKYYTDEYSILTERARLGKSIHKEALRLASLVTGDPHPLINEQIAYCLREVIRNVFEHGQIDQCIIYAQRMPSGYVEAAIVDRGCGIFSSLGEKYNLLTEGEALEAAVKPGVSRADVENLDDDVDAWANSGFGLYVLSEIGKRFGSFVVCSGATMLRTKNGNAVTSSLPHKLAGTAVGLQFKQLKSSGFTKLLREIAAEGMAVATQSGRKVKASQSTQITSVE